MSDSILRWVVVLLLVAFIIVMWESHTLIEMARAQRTEIAALKAEIQRLKTQPPEGMKCKEYKIKSDGTKIRSCWQKIGV